MGMVLDLRDNPLVEGSALAYRLAAMLGKACTDAVLLGNWVENRDLVVGVDPGAVNHVKRRVDRHRRPCKGLESDHVNQRLAKGEFRG